MRILGIETSCDETGVALYDSDQGLMANLLHSQIALHNEYGGVVPELASRNHIQHALPLIQQALQETNTNHRTLHGIAYTAGPGLQGALLIGAGLAQSLGWAWRIPTIEIHHLEAHFLVCMLESTALRFPFLTFLASGAHTTLGVVNGLGDCKPIGESIDDAAGEVFDKIAKLLNLPYPGGPALEKLAKSGNPQRFKLPRPMIQKNNLNFSFSGLKTATSQIWQKHALQDAQSKADLASSFQHAIIDTLAIKCRYALQQTGLKQLVIAGGVMANKKLRTTLKEVALRNNAQIFCPKKELCTDNGAMIAYAGYQYALQGVSTHHHRLTVHPRWELPKKQSY